MMYFNIVFVFITLSAFGSTFAADFCYSEVTGACGALGGEIENCHAKYGAVDDIMKELQNYVNFMINNNWKFLLLSTHFANYEVERPGFAKLFKEHADKLWEGAIKAAKYITKRGGLMDFSYKKTTTKQPIIESYEVAEIVGSAKALDIWKSIAEEVHYIHGEVTRRREGFHDPEVASWLENEFVHEHSSVIRHMAGVVNDLKRLLANPADSSVALFYYDNYLRQAKSSY